MKRFIKKFVATLDDDERYKLFLLVIGAILIIALCVGIYVNFYYKYADIDPLMLGINVGNKKTEEEISKLKTEFNALFNNEVKVNSENVNIFEKLDNNVDEIVSTFSQLHNGDDSFYRYDADIPRININSSIISDINNEIISKYRDPINVIQRKRDGYTSYTVSYCAFVNGSNLSLVIRSSLKEQGKAEKVGIKTYNYNIVEDRLVTLDEMIKLKNTTNKEVQENINKSIQEADAKVQALAKEYGSLYTRDLNSDIYKVENTENFFLTDDGNVYIVYAYGNIDETNEMDVVIF